MSTADDSQFNTTSPLSRKLAMVVQWGDMDAYNHVNNVSFARYAESARIDFLFQTIQYDKHIPEQLDVVLKRLDIVYHRQVIFPDELQIVTHVSRIGTTSMTLRHAMYSKAQADKLVATADSVVVIAHLPTSTPAPLTDSLRHELQRYLIAENPASS